MKLNKKTIKEIENKAKEFFVGASGCHDWTHVERVRNLALKIGKKEKANLSIIEVAAYLHDIGRKEEMDTKGKICHAEKGKELAEEILSKYDLDKETVENIKHCILSHRYRNNHMPETIEAKVLYDADKLDSIGAVGIGRDFFFAGYAGCCHCLYTGNEKKNIKNAGKYEYTSEDSALLEYYYKLSKVKSKILTKAGREIAKERHNFMEEFFKRFEKEIKGVL
ncbi:MAG: HD domain-containing protein [Candidatus Paceibacterota bacterium]